MGTTRIYAIASAQLNSSFPDDNFSTGDSLIAGTYLDDPPGKIALIKYDTSAIQKKRLLSATFGIYIIACTPGTSEHFIISNLRQGWEEDEVTYNNYHEYVLIRPRDYYANFPISTTTQNTWKISNASLVESAMKYGVAASTIVVGSVAGPATFGSSRDSEHVPYADVNWEDVKPYASNITPSSGMVDDNADNTLSWNFAYNADNVPGTLTQAAAEIQWRNTEGTIVTHTINVSGTTKNAVISAGSLPTDSVFQWRIRLQSNDSVWGDWSSWYSISTVDTVQRTCSTLFPNVAYVDSSVINRFSWISASSIGTQATGFDIQLSEDGEAWNTAASVTSENDYYDMPAGTLTAAIKYWRVRSYNSDGVAGVWSSPAQINVIAAPDAPVIVSVSNKNLPVIEWAAVDQQGYELKIIKDNTVVYESGERAGYEKSFKIYTPLVNGSYMLQIRIINEYYLWSEWTEYGFVINTTADTEITLVATGGIYSGAISWEAGTPGDYTYRVVRDDKPIKELTDTSFDDFTGCGTHEYYIRIIKDDVISDSNKVTISVSPESRVIAPVKSPQDILLLTHSKERGNGAYSEEAGQVLVRVAGRRKPIGVSSEFETFSLSMNYAESNREKWFNLRDLFREKKTLIYRNQYGEKQFVLINKLDYEILGGIAYYDFTIQAIDYDEFIAEYFEGYSLLIANYEKFYVKDE